MTTPGDNDKNRQPDDGRTVLDTLRARLGSHSHVLLPDDDAPDAESPLIDASARTSLKPDQRGAHYRVLGKVAEGAMGAIFKSHDSDLGRDVAMKVLLERHAGEDEILQRFIDEAQIGGQLQHPGIVPVYDLGLLEDERPYFTMKLVKGRTLAALLSERSGDLSERRRFLKIFEQVCDTMGYAHSRRVVHRDLKPANIMVGAFGEVQVVDWGLGKVLTSGGIADEHVAEPAQPDASLIETLRSKGSVAGTASLAGAVLGTPMYMSPEQGRGDVEHLDERTDVFGLGAILCEILTGKPPYIGEHDKVLIEVARALQDGAKERLANCGADSFLVDLVERCLSPAPSARPRSAGALADELSTWLAAQEQRARDAEVAKARAEQERKARRLTLALASTVIVGLVAGGLIWQKREADTNARRETLVRNVDDLFAEAQLARGGGSLDDALTKISSARALIDANPTTETELDARVTQLQSDVEHAIAQAALDQEASVREEAFIGELTELTRDASFYYLDADEEVPLNRLTAAFSSFGVDPDGDLETAAEALAKLDRPELVGQALDLWARLSLTHRGFGGNFKRRTELATLVDNDPVRREVRQALIADDRATFERLAQSEGARQTWAPVTATTFAQTVSLLGYGTINTRPLLREISARHPDHVGLHAHLARAEIRDRENGDKIRGLIHASIAYAANPDALESNLAYAFALAQNAHDAEAVAVMAPLIRTSRIKERPSHRTIIDTFQRAIMWDGPLRSHLPFFEAFSVYNPDDGETLNDWGWTHIIIPDANDADFRAGRELALRAMKITGERAASWNTVAVASWLLGDVETTLAAAERSLSLAPEPDAVDVALRTLALHDKGRTDEAQDAWRAMTAPRSDCHPKELAIIASARALMDEQP